MQLHIDGSRQQWFQHERWYDLIVILFDPSSERATGEGGSNDDDDGG
jgi:hypothetical protein